MNCITAPLLSCFLFIDSVRLFEQAFFFATPVFVFFGGALVVQFFTLAQCDFDFDATLLPIQGESDDGEAFLFRCTYKSGQFFFIQE